MIFTPYEQVRFWSCVEVRGKDRCWNWRGDLSVGYGRFRCRGKAMSAHRVAYEMFKGEIPPGQGYHGTVVMHGCDNRKCCNPYHLRLGTNQENSKERQTKSSVRRSNGKFLRPQVIDQIVSDDRTYRAISADLGIAISTVSRIKTRTRDEQARGTPLERVGTSEPTVHY